MLWIVSSEPSLPNTERVRLMWSSRCSCRIKLNNLVVSIHGFVDSEMASSFFTIWNRWLHWVKMPSRTLISLVSSEVLQSHRVWIIGSPIPLLLVGVLDVFDFSSHHMSHLFHGLWLLWTCSSPLDDSQTMLQWRAQRKLCEQWTLDLSIPSSLLGRQRFCALALENPLRESTFGHLHFREKPSCCSSSSQWISAWWDGWLVCASQSNLDELSNRWYRSSTTASISSLIWLRHCCKSIF